MRKTKKGVFFIITFAIVLFAVLTFSGFYTQFGDIKTVYVRGVDDIRWGIDIRGGVDVTFTPPEGRDASDEEMDSVKELISQRMIGLSISDYECYVDYDKDRLIVRFPWKSDDESFDAEAAVQEIGEMAFNGCTEIKNIVIPEHVTAIGKLAFGNCTNLEKITVMNKECEIFDAKSTICNKLFYRQHISVSVGINSITEKHENAG